MEENRHLIASEGMVLTNGELYAVEVWLGLNDSTENWWEITEDEAEALQTEEIEEDVGYIF